MKKILTWLDTNILAILAGFLLVFIPLYPKWPLFDILYGYNVRVRLEDFFVALTALVFAIQFIRRKIVFTWSLPVIGLFTYLSIGALSALFAIFVLGSVPWVNMHIAKTALHWLRRVEYFSLFFIFFGSITSLKRVRVYLVLFFITLLTVIVYGYGQKYLYWPAFSTMNREFSKGWWLYLSSHARVLSTFGGHYDLAAYLVIALTMSWAFFFGTTNKLFKLIFGLLIGGGFWLLILTASRISFGAYIVGLMVVILLWSFKKSVEWGISRVLITVLLSFIIMLSFGDLSDRFLHLLRLDERLNAVKEVVLRPSAPPPKNNAVFFENTVAAISDQPPVPARPVDFNTSQKPQMVASISATGQTIMVSKPLTYSQNALIYDLSTAIRLDATWPQAIRSFQKDPLLGTGYATLSKTSVFEFTDAESTDNDYLRALGETGLLGFLSFFGTLGLIGFLAFRVLGGLNDNFLYSLTVGYIGLLVGLCTNAGLIDIFESSKVAYVFWSITGITLGTHYLLRDKIATNMHALRLSFSFKKHRDNFIRFMHSDIPWISLIIIISFLLRTYKISSPIADWHSWRQADTSAVTRNFLKQNRINFLYPTYDDISSIASGKPNPSGYRFVEFPFYNAETVIMTKIIPELGVEAAGRATSNVMYSLGLVFIFLICRRLFSRRIGYLAGLTYALIPYGIYYGRTILPDPSMVTMSLGAIYFSTSYLFKKKFRYLFLMTIFSASTILLKPYAIFLLLPIVYLWFMQFRFNLKPWVYLILVGAISVAPFLLWRQWMRQFPEGIPASNWLLNGNGIRFKGAFWYWLFADRIGRLILGYWGLIPLGFGLVRKGIGKFGYFPLIFFGSSLVYLFVFATGNVQHDYYQILLLPSLAILVGVGLDFLLFTINPTTNSLLTKMLAVVCFVFMLAFGWYFVKDYFNINHPEIVEAGNAMREISNDNQLVIAPYGGDTAFLYQTNRRGWPIVEGSIDDMIRKGADYYISVRFDDLTKQLMAKSATVNEKKQLVLKGKPIPMYTLLKLTDTFVIIQLVPDNLLPKP